ncbi:transcription initiation factor TFIID [Paenibacillus zeisoli]|uniref:Transcription initiation factor TFIID n=1 Tax=Paenibacillus zeisoli TaxID=2496267 RepID=A0A3S1JNY9_9BACL|nr:transcription initiation factor TFIID [Paenibacillus zeisoli]RUT31759.1 transcription initiation factor TFIID [Paenibacillus zeisoli]
MRQLLEQYAADYAAAEEGLTGKQDDQSSIHYPAVYLFIGDKVADAIDPIIRIHDKKWDNSAGVMYFHLTSQEGAAAGVTAAFSPSYGEGKVPGGERDGARDSERERYGLRVEDGERDGIRELEGVRVREGERDEEGARKWEREHPRVVRYRIPRIKSEESEINVKTLRPDTYRAFYQEPGSVLELNRALRRVSQRIADYGRLYSSFDRIHLSVITQAGDPLNVFVPEVTVLANTIFGQSFKSVQTDLFTLISEREDAEAFGYSGAAGIAFLRELDMMQQSDYTFSGPLLMTEDGLSIPVTHSASPLFDLVYVLSDKNERGVSSPGGLRDNDEIISQISLLKNRQKKDSLYDSVSGAAYNNMSFKNNIMTESGRQGYVSAGFSKVKRPNESIALTVLYHFYRQLIQRMNGPLEWKNSDKLSFFGLDPDSLAEQARRIVPDETRLDDMNGMMTHGVSYSSLKSMTLQEAEAALFGDGGELYFQGNYVREADRALAALRLDEELEATVRRSRALHPQVGLFHLAEWTDEAGGSGSLREAYRSRIRELAGQVESAKAELVQTYQGLVHDQPFQRLPMMDKHNVRSFIRYFIDHIYALKLYILRLEMELKLARQYEVGLDLLHDRFRKMTQQLEELEDTLRSSALQSIRLADDYIGQNIMEYYERVTADVLIELEARRGADILFQDRYMGSPAEMLSGGIQGLTERMIAVCRRDILTSEPFSQTFEEELLRRANVTVEYNNKQVLSKDELFKKLYRTLEEHAVIHVRLFDYTHEHRYEEKYFFGDAGSEFMRYALGADETSRIYKLGMVHENRSSGVEKLCIMGGFHLEDLMFYRNGKVYYETYIQNGYEFHSTDPKLLPELR